MCNDEVDARTAVFDDESKAPMAGRSERRSMGAVHPASAFKWAWSHNAESYDWMDCHSPFSEQSF
jgi:hypothetical protein